mgnify:CR=1 FL=1
MHAKKKRRQSAAQLREREEIVDDVRQAERDLNTALWRFHDALGHDQVDYAIFTLEAAEKKLDMLLRKAKALWGVAPQDEEGRGNVG